MSENKNINDIRVLLTPAEQMLKIREIVVECEDQREAMSILSAYFRDTNRLQERLRELEDRAWIRETEFQSQTPVIGRIIVFIRSIWNWMSTKWYVLPMLQQQNNFNASVVQMIRDLWACNRALMTSVSSLQKQVEKLEKLLVVQEVTNGGD